jgi:oligopeptide/dipeptide ABC transporter ATP-binding protein
VTPPDTGDWDSGDATMPAAIDPPLLEVEGLTVSFWVEGRWLDAVRSMDFGLEQGETLAVVGESGSGKSATMSSILGLLPGNGRVVASRIALSGRQLDPNSRSMRDVRGRAVGFVFQDPQSSLNPVLTVGRQMTEHMMHHLGSERSVARDRALELLARAGIPNPRLALGRFPFEFSGGMRQRIALTVALMCSPSLLIADEPTTALDVTVQAQILDLLMELRDDFGIGIVFITHDLSVAAIVADRVAVMYAGQIVESGLTEEINNAPRHPYTRGLLASMPSIENPVIPTGIPGAPPDLESVPEGCAFAARCGDYQPGQCDEEQWLEPVSATQSVRCVRWRELS